MNIEKFATDFAKALKLADEKRPREKNYKPGIGPHEEDHQVELALEVLNGQGKYIECGKKKYPNSREECDLVIDGKLAVEFKLLRPLGNNGKDDDKRWLIKILYPSYGNVSAIGDVLKLKQSGFSEKKVIALLTYFPINNNEVKEKIDTTLTCFEFILNEVYKVQLGERVSEKFNDLIHPVHNTGVLHCWEIKE
tara:strand:- start:242 stop:823 length:582 start_codon:yes stop_codon:yes gene_type:complete